MKETSITTRSTFRRAVPAVEIASVGLLQQADARVLAQPEIDLAMSGIHGDDVRCSTLQKTIGKSSG